MICPNCNRREPENFTQQGFASNDFEVWTCLGCGFEWRVERPGESGGVREPKFVRYPSYIPNRSADCAGCIGIPNTCGEHTCELYKGAPIGMFPVDDPLVAEAERLRAENKRLTDGLKRLIEQYSTGESRRK